MIHPQQIEALQSAARSAHLRPCVGYVTDIRGQSIRGRLLGGTLGAICEIEHPTGVPLRAEIIAMTGDDILLSPFGSTEGCRVHAPIRPMSEPLGVHVCDDMLGRVIDVFGTPVDDGDPFERPAKSIPVRKDTPTAMDRPMIDAPFVTGVRALDGTATLGIGQRIGIFGPPGTGKTSLLGMLASHCEADVVVIGLVGERGREVREFVEEVLPPEQRSCAVVVAATSDRPAIERSICALTATTVAEYFRDQGKRVFLLIDSLTRTARALRELGLAAGEAPTRRGYPASVYPALPAIIERAGRTRAGDITAVYTVLTEGEMESDPIAEEVRSLTDGHIVLSRKLAEQNHFPAIDVCASLSRTMSRIVERDHADAAGKLRRALSKYDEIELLLQVGEYSEGNDPEADRAVEIQEHAKAFLRQRMEEPTRFDLTVNAVRELAR